MVCQHNTITVTKQKLIDRTLAYAWRRGYRLCGHGLLYPDTSKIVGKVIHVFKEKIIDVRFDFSNKKFDREKACQDSRNVRALQTFFFRKTNISENILH